MNSTQESKETKGLKKLWLKVRASLKSGSSSNMTATAAVNPTTPTKAVVTPAPAVPVESSAKAPEMKPETYSAKDEAAKRFERAQAIFKKYDMELDPADWDTRPKTNVERVQKQPRMRVRWTCHECQGSFGREPNCRTCSHERCKQCVRYPPKKNKSKPAVDKAAPAPAEMPKSGPCHECRTQFPIGATECANCQHKICETCLKETVIESPATAPATNNIAVAAA